MHRVPDVQLHRVRDAVHIVRDDMLLSAVHNRAAGVPGGSEPDEGRICGRDICAADVQVQGEVVEQQGSEGQQGWERVGFGERRGGRSGGTRDGEGEAGVGGGCVVLHLPGKVRGRRGVEGAALRAPFPCGVRGQVAEDQCVVPAVQA